MLQRLPLSAPASVRREQYLETRQRIAAAIAEETDWIAAMATVACELHQSFAYYDWTGFYRAVAPALLVIGPYQGHHGCLRIDFSRGVCGAAARTRRTQLVPDVTQFPGYIACSSNTKSEIVVPIVTPSGRLLGVLDVDSDAIAAFTTVDQQQLEALCVSLGEKYGATPVL